MKNITYSPIGIIHSPFKESRGTPIQSRAAKGSEGLVEVFPEYAKGLEDLDGFSHLFLVYHCHLTTGRSLKVKPFLDDTSHGVFSTRAPGRPNPIGISIVRLISQEGNELRIEELDILDGTPLLDIKPYVPEFDSIDTKKIGWLEKNVSNFHSSKDDGRFSKPKV